MAKLRGKSLENGRCQAPGRRDALGACRIDSFHSVRSCPPGPYRATPSRRKVHDPSGGCLSPPRAIQPICLGTVNPSRFRRWPGSLRPVESVIATNPHPIGRRVAGRFALCVARSPPTHTDKLQAEASDRLQAHLGNDEKIHSVECLRLRKPLPLKPPIFV